MRSWCTTYAYRSKCKLKLIIFSFLSFFFILVYSFVKHKLKSKKSNFLKLWCPVSLLLYTYIFGPKVKCCYVCVCCIYYYRLIMVLGHILWLSFLFLLHLFLVKYCNYQVWNQFSLLFCFIYLFLFVLHTLNYQRLTWSDHMYPFCYRIQNKGYILF